MARKRDPNSHAPTTPTRLQKVSMENVEPRLQDRLINGRENPVRISSGGQEEWPVDCPVRIDVHRVLGIWEHDTAGPAEGLMGHIVDLDFYTKETRVQIKMYRDPNALAILANDEEVYRWVENPDDLPTGGAAVREKQIKLDGAWADQVDLQPGDEVIDGDDGLEIIRADDDDVVWD